MSDKKQLPKFTLALLGKSGGKTQMINRFLHDEFTEESSTTIICSITSTMINVQGELVQLKIFDSTRTDDRDSSFFADINAFLVTFSVCGRYSFLAAKSQLLQLHLLFPNSLKCLIGNKSDATPREVTFYEASTFASKYSLKYTETSAKENKNITELFEEVARDLLSKAKGMPISSNQELKKKQSMPMQLPNELLDFNCVICGHSAVGKSSIIQKHFPQLKKEKGANGPKPYMKTQSITLGKEEIEVNIWSIPLPVRSCSTEFLLNSHIILVVYSITDYQSFEKAKEFIAEYYYKMKRALFFVLLGNKKDLSEEREVMFEEGSKVKEGKEFLIFSEVNAMNDLVLSDYLKKFIPFVFSKRRELARIDIQRWFR